MAKKKGLNLGMILGGAAALLGLVAIFMLFVPNLTTEVLDTTVEYSGLETVFGAEHKSTVMGHEVSTAIFDFSFLSFLPYLLVLVGVVLSVLAVLGKLGKIAPIAAAACFVVAAILFFIAVPTCVLHNSADATAEQISKAKESLSLGAGVIVAGVLSIVAGLANAANLVLNKK